MLRDAQIPIALWMCAAILVHLVGGGGAVSVAELVQERADLRAMVRGVREEVRERSTLEFVLTGVEPTPPSVPPKTDRDVAPPEDVKDPQAEAEKKKKEQEEAKKLKPKKLAKKLFVAPPLPKPAEKPKPKKEAPPPPAPSETAKPKAPPPPPPPPPPPAVAKAEEKKAPPPPPPPPPDNRLAVRQHAKKDQPDNPNAHRIADDANHVDEESVARVRVKDHDAPEPTAGSGSKGPDDEEGNADHDKVADSENKRGDPLRGPGEAAPKSTSSEHHNPAPPSPVAAAANMKGPPQSAPGSQGGGAGPSQVLAPSEASPGSPGGAGPASPEVTSAEGGGWRMDPANPGGDGKSRVPGAKQAATPYVPPVSVGSMGFGVPGIPGGPNLNLTLGGLEAAVGTEQLKREREADGEARKSAHRGSSKKTSFQDLKGAIENYEPSVKLGNQTALNAARVPFASYLNGIHNRIHPIFAEEFLAALDNLPAKHTLNQDLITHVEIVLSKDEGRIVRVGVTRGSGSTAFDAAALNSVIRASPYGKAPDVIVSPDGNVYVHWEFHRDPFDACTTRNARPFLLKSAPPSKEKPILPRPLGSKPSDERKELPPPLVPLRQP